LNNFGSAKILLHGTFDGKFAANLRRLKNVNPGEGKKSHTGCDN